MFDKIKILKFVATGIVGMGTGKIVGGIIKNNITPETLIQKVTITAASFVISSVVTKATKNHTDEMIDNGIEQATKIVDKIKLENKLGRIQRGESSFQSEGLDQSLFRIDPQKGRWVRIAEDDPEAKSDVVTGEVVDES